MIFDPRAVELVHGEAGGPILRRFNQAGVLAPADLHAALRLGQIGAETDESVLLAAALAVRALRVGNVSVDLASVESVVVAGPDEEMDISALPWPSPDRWISTVGASPLVGSEPGEAESEQAPGDDGGGFPLRLLGTHLYLDRYWRDELTVAAGILTRVAGPEPTGPDAPAIDDERLDAGLVRLFGDSECADQREAARAAARGRFTVIAGGPGTGKTTTVARVLALIREQAAGRAPLVGLVAPTGKAAARLEEAVRAAATDMDVSAEVRRWLGEVRGSTVHRLLGTRPGTSSLFRHDRHHRLPHDIVVVDEASMMSLALMARLIEAVRPDARLVLVGDPEQLVSVEAGVVLADIVGPPPALQSSLPVGRATPAPAAPPLASRVVRLTTNHRFSGALADLAEAVRGGEADLAVRILSGRDPAVTWEDAESGSPRHAELVQREVAGWAGRIVGHARRGDATGALVELRRNRVLCAHRDGPAGTGAWNKMVERLVAAERPDLDSEGTWYGGRPVLVTANDYSLRLFNGDTGVAVAGPDAGISVAFPDRDGQPRMIGSFRLSAIETVFAMTVHKSQGSEFEQVTLVLPGPESRLLTRELLYTAVTRARERVVVVGSEAALRAAISRPISRASGLAARLWRSPVEAADRIAQGRS